MVSEQTEREYEIKSEETLDALTNYLEDLAERINDPTYDIAYSVGGWVECYRWILTP